MKVKIAKNVAKILVARMIENELKDENPSQVGFYSDCSDCNEMVKTELLKLSDKLLGSFNDIPSGNNEMLEALGALEQVNIGKRQGRLDL